MKINKAVQVLKNLETNLQGEVFCGKCVFPRKRNCYFRNIDCQLLAVKTVLKALEEKDKEIKELKVITQNYNSYCIESNSNSKIIIADSEYFENGFFKENFIYKEIIENKIKELEKQTYVISSREEEIRILKELLNGNSKNK